MYHYSESGLPNVYLKNGYSIDVIDDEEYTSIDDLEGLHHVLAKTIASKAMPLTNAEFKFLRIELNLSQRILGKRFGVSEQTIARYEKGQSDIPRTTDAALRSLYMESIEQNNSVSYFLDLLANYEAEQAAQEILLEEVDRQWKLAV
ncbi:MAG: transcriptional regulator [Idiomarina sp. 34-48-12]|nr:MAG: transcriptional regulator [Idiomarina sp. 34-48-12]